MYTFVCIARVRKKFKYSPKDGATINTAHLGTFLFYTAPVYSYYIEKLGFDIAIIILKYMVIFLTKFEDVME